MNFKNPWVSATERLLTKEAEHALYEKAANDIELDNIHKGIWTKAFSLSEGNEQKQKAKYIELMVEYYKDLILAGEEIEDILETEDEKRKKAEAEQKRKNEKLKAEQRRKEEQLKTELKKKEEERNKQEQKEIEAKERIRDIKNFNKKNQSKWDKKLKNNKLKHDELFKSSDGISQSKNKKMGSWIFIVFLFFIVFFTIYLSNMFQSNQSNFILEKHNDNINWALQDKVRFPSLMPYEIAGIDLFKQAHPELSIEKDYKPGNLSEASFFTCINRYEYINNSIFYKARWFYAYEKYRLGCLYNWKFYYIRTYLMRDDKFDALNENVISNNISMSLVYRAKDKYYTKNEIRIIDERINEFFQN